MILCVGEILADMIGSRSEDGFNYEVNAGGAPFNVACALDAFGAKSGFVGSVGRDTIGNYLRDFAASRRLEYCDIRVDDFRKTTLAFVTIDGKGERSFCFYRENTADAYLMPITDDAFAASDIICLGSLMLSAAEGLAYAEATANRAHDAGKRIAFDVNMRSDIFADEREMRERYLAVIELADIVKFSEDEAEFFGEEYIRSLSDKLVLITLGDRGAEWRYKGKSATVATLSVEPTDTTGAGDAFFAGVLAMLDGAEAYDDCALNKAVRFGCVAGALNTLGRGAIANLPTREEIDKYVEI